MLVETIYTGIKICALASVCAYGWLRVQQERKAETAKEQAEKTTCKNCCYCRMIMTDSRIVCELEEKPIEQPVHCTLFTEWPERLHVQLMFILQTLQKLWQVFLFVAI